MSKWVTTGLLGSTAIGWTIWYFNKYEIVPKQKNNTQNGGNNQQNSGNNQPQNNGQRQNNNQQQNNGQRQNNNQQQNNGQRQNNNQPQNNGQPQNNNQQQNTGNNNNNNQGNNTANNGKKGSSFIPSTLISTAAVIVSGAVNGEYSSCQAERIKKNLGIAQSTIEALPDAELEAALIQAGLLEEKTSGQLDPKVYNK